MAEAMIKAVRGNRRKKKKAKNKFLSSFASTDAGITLDNSLSTDEWLVQNTLLFVITFLGVPDVLRCRQVCKLWRDIIDSHHPIWRSLTFTQKHKLKIEQMIPFLQLVKPQYLRFIGCEFVVPSIESSLGNPEEARLKSVFQELCICNYPRLPHEIVPRKVYLGWFAETSELKITLSSCYHSYHISDERRIIQSLPGLIRELDNFKVLSIVWHIRQKFYRPEELALPRSIYTSKTRNKCTDLESIIAQFLRDFPDLKELCFEYYEFPKKGIMETVNSVRKLPNLTCLQLSEIEVPEGFETVLKLCTNLNDLMISPLLNKSSMGRINGRIFEGVKGLELKNLVWFFAHSYLQEFRKQFFVTFRCELENWQTVPFVGDADCLHENFLDPEHKLPAWRLITFPDLKEELRKLMVNCEVTVQMQIDILYFEFNGFRSPPAHIITGTLGERLSEDHWFIQNTLPYILPLLDASDVVNCGKVCKSWQRIISLGERLSADEWLVQNTLPFIVPYLKVPDVLRSMQVCKVWQQVINESTFWRSITLSRYTLHLDKMISFLGDVGTKNLRITECKIYDAEHNCSRTSDPDESEVLQVSVQTNPGSTKLDVYLWGVTASLFKELEPHKLGCLLELRTLKSLMLTKIFALKRDHKRKKPIKLPGPESTQHSNLLKFIQMHMNNIRPLMYLSFLIYEYPNFDLIKSISDLRFLPDFRGLHLLEIPIMEGFENVLNICPGLRTLRLSPLFRKRYVARDNGRIFEGVKKLRLTNLVWIFSDDYTFQCDKLVAEEMSESRLAYVNSDFLVPLIGDANFLHDDLHESEHHLPSFRLVEWSGLQDELQRLMVGCRVQIIINPIF